MAFGHTTVNYVPSIGTTPPTTLSGFQINLYKYTGSTTHVGDILWSTTLPKATVPTSRKGSATFDSTVGTPPAGGAKLNTQKGVPFATVFNVILEPNAYNLPVNFWIEIKAVMTIDYNGVLLGTNAGTAGSVAQRTTNKLAFPVATSKVLPFLFLAFDDTQAHNDPHIVGFNGQKFDFCGIKDQVFNFYSDPHFQVNTLLQYVKVRAPLHKRDIKPPTHIIPGNNNSCILKNKEGTYITEIGVRLALNEEKITIKLVNGIIVAKYNGKSVTEETTIISCGLISFDNASGKLYVLTDGYELTITANWNYFDINFMIPLSSFELPTGMFTGYVGQTLDENRESDVPSDFLVASKDILGLDYPNNPYKPNSLTTCFNNLDV